MPFKFDIEGPETRKQRELDQRLRDIQIKSAQALLEKENPEMRATRLDQAAAVLQDPNATPGQFASAYQTAKELGGTRQVPGFGDVPLVMPEESLNQVLVKTFETNAQRLAYANRRIQEAEASGDRITADALRQQRDAFFKNADKNYKKPPIKTVEDLVEYKNLLNLANEAIELNNSFYSGPVMGRVGAAMSSMGYAPDYTKMNQAYAGIRNQILNKMAGTAVTEAEAQRLLDQIGNPMTGDYLQRLKLFSQQRRREYLDKLQAIQEAGFEIPPSLDLNSTRQTQNAPKETGGNVLGKYSIDPSTGQVIRAK